MFLYQYCRREIARLFRFHDNIGVLNNDELVRQTITVKWCTREGINLYVERLSRTIFQSAVTVLCFWTAEGIARDNFAYGSLCVLEFVILISISFFFFFHTLPHTYITCVLIVSKLY